MRAGSPVCFEVSLCLLRVVGARMDGQIGAAAAAACFVLLQLWLIEK